MLELWTCGCEEIEAAAIVLPVDGVRPAVGGGAGRALRASIPAQDRAEVLDELDEELASLAPIPHGHARILGEYGRWQHLLVAAAFLHNVDGVVFSAAQHAAAVAAAVGSALDLAAHHAIPSVTLTPIGTASRVSPRTSLRSLILAAAPRMGRVRICLSLIEPEHQEESIAILKELSIPYSLNTR